VRRQLSIQDLPAHFRAQALLAALSLAPLTIKSYPACLIPTGALFLFCAFKPRPSSQELLQVFISEAFAQSAPPAADAAGSSIGSSLSSMWPLLAMFAVLYFIMIRPQMKKQKEHRAMVDALAKGDEVVTASGLMGKVTSLSDSSVSLLIAADVEVQMQRSAVVQVLPKGTIK
jgi:preprotein translocase subunit YajC